MPSLHQNFGFGKSKYTFFRQFDHLPVVSIVLKCLSMLSLQVGGECSSSFHPNQSAYQGGKDSRRLFVIQIY